MTQNRPSRLTIRVGQVLVDLTADSRTILIAFALVLGIGAWVLTV
jgi:hypothetical protein